MSLQTQITLQPFEKLATDFVGPVELRGKMAARYIIIVTQYLTQWAEVQPVKDCMAMTAAKFLFKNVLTRFGYPKILMSDRGMHFLNEIISELMEEFKIYHQQSMPYHSQANGIVEAFNKILETALTKVQKQCKKVWHNRHIKLPTFKENDLVLLYDSKFEKVPGKLCMHWLGPYVIKEVTDGGVVPLAKLNGDPFSGRVNGSCLKLYTGGLAA
eukprot:PITA_29266